VKFVAQHASDADGGPGRLERPDCGINGFGPMLQSA
jgi:hypothetical protein